MLRGRRGGGGGGGEGGVGIGEQHGLRRGSLCSMKCLALVWVCAEASLLLGTGSVPLRRSGNG